jgi:hypothetical protein
MDVDSLIHNELSVFDEMEGKVDLGFAYQLANPSTDPRFPKASPIYFSYNELVEEFIKYWIEQCEENEKGNGQKVFDHEILMGVVLPKFMNKLKLGCLPINYAIWPGTGIPQGMKPMITMGIADGTSKEKSLREMGLTEDIVKYNLVGDKL